MKNHEHNSQDILWREWRNTDDRDFADQLYAMLAEEPVGKIAAVVMTFLGVLGGSMVGIVRFLWVQQYWQYLNGGADGRIVAAMISGALWKGAIIGGAWGLCIGLIACRQVTWRRWLGGLAPNKPPKLMRLALIATMALGTGLLSMLDFWRGTILAADWVHFALSLGSAVMVAGSLLGLTFGLGSLLKQSPFPYDYRKRCFWWRQRPHPFVLEKALRQAGESQNGEEGIWAGPLRQLEDATVHPQPLQSLITGLHSESWIDRFIARHALVASGSRAAEPLCDVVDGNGKSPVRSTVFWLLKSISEDTAERLAARAEGLLCPECFVRCSAHTVWPSRRTPFTSFGCRSCGQSQEFLEWPGTVIAVMDRGMEGGSVQKEEALLVNWLLRKVPFDCDQVEIVNATDEEVERLVVQMGNDMDAVRSPRYRKMLCRIAPQCDLSENTMRILKSAFGTVEVMRA